jgi:hypothetical protein
MLESGPEICTDSSLQALRESRDVAAALKLEFLRFRANSPKAVIFAFEGKDDKIIYSHWIRQYCNNFEYEPFPCNNKHRTLKLKNALERDLNGLEENVYFFVDRDFDDLPPMENTTNVFMTDKYSVENYLVSSSVLDLILRNEFHCHIRPECRSEIINLFDTQLLRFLEVTRDLNLRIFTAKRLGINRTEEISSKLSHIANITLNEVSASSTPLSEVVKLEREPSDSEISSLVSEFNQLDPSARYRGKFIYKFFVCWLKHLATDRNSDESALFPDFDRVHLKAPQSLSLDSLASKALPPAHLFSFLKNIINPVEIKYA